MNQVNLIGRITKDLELKYTNNQTAKVSFSLAINGKDRTDYPRIIVWGKQAENLEKYCGKGSLVGITGRIQTGNYEQDGKTVYVTDVYADHIEFLSWDKKGEDY